MTQEENAPLPEATPIQPGGNRSTQGQNVIHYVHGSKRGGERNLHYVVRQPRPELYEPPKPMLSMLQLKALRLLGEEVDFDAEVSRLLFSCE